MWVTEFEIKYSEDGEEWQNIKNEEGGTDFQGNNDRKSTAEIMFPDVDKYPYQIRAKQIRLYPKKWYNWPCLRWELFFQ